MSRRPPRRVSQQVSGEAALAVATGFVALSQGVQVVELAVDAITPNVDQPRRIFDDDALAALAASINDKGLLQPILVKRDTAAEGRYILAAGERRWRAHKLIGKATIRAIVVTGSVDEIAIVENAQRVDLHPVENAMAIHRLSEQRGCTDEGMASLTGFSRVEITKLIAVAKLGEDILHGFLGMSPPPSKSALFEVAMAPEPIQEQLARLVVSGASIADLRRARKEAEAPPATTPVGSLRPARSGIGIGRRIGSITKALDVRRAAGQPLSPEDRNHLLRLRAAVDALLTGEA